MRTLLGVLVLSAGLFSTSAAAPNASFATELPNCFRMGAGSNAALSMWVKANGCGVNSPDWHIRGQLKSPNGSVYREWTGTMDTLNSNGDLVDQTVALPVGGSWTFVLEDWYTGTGGSQQHGYVAYTFVISGGTTAMPKPTVAPTPKATVKPEPKPTVKPTVAATPKATVALVATAATAPSVEVSAAPSADVTSAPASAEVTSTPICAATDGFEVAGATSINESTEPSLVTGLPPVSSVRASADMPFMYLIGVLGAIAALGGWFILLMRRRRSK